MRRTKNEILAMSHSLLDGRTDDEVVSYFEDLSDSLGDVDLSAYVSRDDYDAVVTERDAAKADAEDIRTRYINRFFREPEEGEAHIIDGAAPQGEIIKDEEDIGYEDLFE